MRQEIPPAADAAACSDIGTLAVDDRYEADILIRSMRRSAKGRRRLLAWIVPLIAAGMAATVLIFSRVDMRLSLTIFGVSAAIIAAALAREAGHWESMANQAAVLCDVRAIGPLLTVLNDRDSSACESIEEALIDLLPRVERLNQLSRNARRELNRLLMEFEMPGLRGGHNAELARTALELVDRFRDCSALPAVRRLADGFTATRPAAQIRDLANDMLADLEERAALLRPSLALDAPETSYLRPANGREHDLHSEQLLRAATQVPCAASFTHHALSGSEGVPRQAHSGCPVDALDGATETRTSLPLSA